ncbi:MAG TPA: hypothetical protein VN635_16015 [Conexibacter sp.]|nr:hypothetical protein [Conexibacter sp.]
MPAAGAAAAAGKAPQNAGRFRSDAEESEDLQAFLALAESSCDLRKTPLRALAGIAFIAAS